MVVTTGELGVPGLWAPVILLSLPHHREPPSPHPALTVCSVAARNAAKAINRTDRLSKDQNTGTPHFIVLCFIAIRNKEK